MEPQLSERPSLSVLNTGIVVGFPALCALLVPLYVWHYGLTWFHLWVFLSLWWVTGLGITAGYHRLFSHRSYQASTLLKVFFAMTGAAACQNSILEWSEDHRHHHRSVDTDRDPYNAKRGFWWSHVGWVLFDDSLTRQRTMTDDLGRDPLCQWQHTYYLHLAIGFNVLVPLCVGLLVGDALGALLFGGLVRIVMVHHFTFFINSLAHIWGRQPWSRSNTSRDNWLLSLLTLGEGYHNYHHAFQTDYRNGPKWYNFDPTKWLIWSCSRVGLAGRLSRVPLERRWKKRFEETRGELRRLFDERSEVDWAQLVGAEQRLEAALGLLQQARYAYRELLERKKQEGERVVSAVQEAKQAWKEQKRQVRQALEVWEQAIAELAGPELGLGAYS